MDVKIFHCSCYLLLKFVFGYSLFQAFKTRIKLKKTNNLKIYNYTETYETLDNSSRNCWYPGMHPHTHVNNSTIMTLNHKNMTH